MNTTDIIPFWTEPAAITQWGEKCTPPISPAWFDYINFKFHPDDLIAICRIIFPEFSAIKEVTLLKKNTDGHLEESILKFIEHAKSSIQFEKEFNVFRIYELFSHADDASEESFYAASILLKKSWEISLLTAFPNKRFEVLLLNEAHDYGPTITFYQCRDEEV